MTEYGLLEEQLFFDIDEILLEGFPPIILGLKKKYKDKLAQYFYVGPNSQQKKITKEEAIKAPYSTGLVITLDADYEPLMALLGSKLVKLKDEVDTFNYGWRRRKPKKETTNRKKELEKATYIYYISPDKDTHTQINKRETTREQGKPYLFKKEDIEAITTKESFERIVKGYYNKKIKEIQKETPNIVTTLEKLLKSNRESFIKKLSTTKELDFDYYVLNDDSHLFWTSLRLLIGSLSRLQHITYDDKNLLPGIVTDIVENMANLKKIMG